ncbi:hypothetical protein ACFVGW_06670 [Streptomyces sp. NPDC127129]|uniref:hypothetical protein n=1 Tax=Streptomyces sp. NPDC127129 TaxID=3345373 RepID=UPI00362C10D3
MIGTVFLTMLVVFVPVALFMGAMIGFMIALVTAASSTGSGSDSAMTASGFALVALLVALATMPLATWIWVKLSLAPTAAVFEGQGATASMRRSGELVRGSWWRIFGALLVAGLMAGMANWLIQQVLSTLLSFPVSLTAASDVETPGEVMIALVPVLVIAVVGGMLAQAVCSVFPPLVTGLVYVDQRIRKENLAPALVQAAGTPPFSP